MSDHEHKWEWNEDEEYAPAFPFICSKCKETMNWNTAFNKLNEYEELLDALEVALPFLQREDLWDDGGEWHKAQLKVFTAIRKHKGE